MRVLLGGPCLVSGFGLGPSKNVWELARPGAREQEVFLLKFHAWSESLCVRNRRPGSLFCSVFPKRHPLRIGNHWIRKAMHGLWFKVGEAWLSRWLNLYWHATSLATYVKATYKNSNFYTKLASIVWSRWVVNWCSYPTLPYIFVLHYLGFCN